MTVAETIKDQVEYLAFDYDINEMGIIESPGTFEGEPVYVLYFWDESMICQDDMYRTEDGIWVSRFEVTEVEKQVFPDLMEYRFIDLWSDDCGFVNHQLID